MNLFTLGPVNMSEDIKQLGSNAIPYFRTSEFSNVMLDIEKIFLKLVDASDGAKLAVLTSSGTGAMEATIINFILERDKVLIIDGGSFGHRFVEICQCYQIPHDVLHLEFNEVLSKQKLEKYNNKGYAALLVNIHETSLGKLYDYKLLGQFCRQNHMYYIVDGISTFLADELSMKIGTIDVLILSSQKALALPPGLSFIIASKRIIEERLHKTQKKTVYFNLINYFSDMERGQTPFTPAVGIIYQLYYQLIKLVNIDLSKVIEYHRGLAIHFRNCCRKENIQFVDYPMSNAVTTLLFQEENAIHIFERLKTKYEFILTPSGGEWKNKILRVGHIGEHTIEEYTILAQKLNESLKGN